MSSGPPPPGAAPEAAPRIPDLELVRQIGRGSYGEVWLARSATGAYRAVKVVYRGAFDHDRPYEREFAGLKRFEAISRTSESQLDILHVGRNDAAGYFFYEMELADDVNHGQAINPTDYVPRTLAHELRRRGRLAVSECLDIGLQLARALDHLHAHGLVHRDVKPSNIVFVGGVPKLADIGLVTGMGATRSFVGTEGYVPPEGPGTPQADLYSLGKVLYEMSTGRDRLDYPELSTALRGSPEREQMVRLNEVVLRACEDDRSARHKTAGELVAALQGVRTGLPPAQRASFLLPRSANHVLAALAVAVAMLAGWLVWFRPRLAVVQRWAQPRGQFVRLAQPAEFDDLPGKELLLAGSNALSCYSVRGKLPTEWACAQSNLQYLSVWLVTNVLGDWRDEVFISWVAGTNLGVAVVDYTFSDVSQFTAVGREPHVRSEGPTSLLEPHLVSGNGDGRTRLVAAIDTAYGLNPCFRGLLWFDWASGRLLREQLSGPRFAHVLAVDLNADKVKDFVCGSHASDNGNQGPDGTDDSHGYVLAFSDKGDRLWATNLSGPLSVAQPFLAELDGEDPPELLAWVYTDESRHGPGPWMFTSDDLNDLPTLLRNLTNATRLIDGYVARRLSPKTIDALKVYPGGGAGAGLKAELAQHLNTILVNGSVYDDAVFRGVRLRPETEQLRAQKPQADGCRLLNRLLLEDAYPRELGKLSEKPVTDLPPLGRVVQLDYAGHVVREYPRPSTQVCLKSCIAADLDGDHRQEIVCSDCEGFIHVLNPDLTPRRPPVRIYRGAPKRPGTFDYVRVELASSARLGRTDQVHVLGWADIVRMKTHNFTGRPDTPAAPTDIDTPEILELNTELRVGASYRVKVNAPLQWQARVVDMDGDGRDEILVLTDHVEVLKLRR